MSIISKIQKQSFKSGSNGSQDIFEEKVDKKPLILSEESEDQYEADVEKFKEGFSEPALKRQSTVGLVTNFNMIYMILISITDLFIKNVEFSKNRKDYFEISDKDSEIQKDVDDAFEIDVSPLDF